ncbi:galactose-1-phosphate uridylyltransferase [Micromonospora echinofusca]|uniref:Galactose-1-phosphate uridylyltransferase n=1 Tax=Micromonospora echinofusca TaxID=47858 RepID=A0ABS3VNR4_MICEH|nr:galactose-1-phosphate uridylyltransferase [Micromonospora echinofusca]
MPADADPRSSTGDVHTSVTRLADGRELIYYDRAPVRRDSWPDRRDLPDRPATGSARLDPRTGDWVIVATHRQNRIFLPAATDCPLCPSLDGRQTEVPAPDYAVVVFENRFPALVGAATGAVRPAPVDGVAGAVDPVAGPGPLAPTADTGADLLAEMPATGRCEVVCFDSRHDVTFAGLDTDQAGLALAAWSDRTRALSARPDIRQVYCFENRGPEIGVTQHHPHGQIYAYPFVLPRTRRMLDRAAAHRAAHGSNLFDDLVAAETADGSRIVAENDHWTAFVPFAARWPYEVHLYPRRRVPDLPHLDPGARAALTPIYLDLLRRFDRLFDAPAPYIAAWHQAPDAPGAAEFALHLELFTNRRTSSKLKYLAGTESGMDAFSNDIVPEEAARRLREVGAA